MRCKRVSRRSESQPIRSGRSRLAAALALGWLAAGCQAPYQRPPAMGPESVGSAAKARLGQAAKEGAFVAVVGATTVAVHSPGTPRPLGKALELLKGWLAQNQEDSAIRRDVLSDLPALVKTTELGRWSCELRPALADLFAVMQQRGQAGDVLLRAARQCGSVSAALAAVSHLQSAGRCDDAIAGMRALWPRARPQDKTPILDAVTRCTAPLFLEQSLAFAGAPIVKRYLAALERKKQREEAAQEAARQQEEEERPQREAERSEREADQQEAAAQREDYRKRSGDLWDDKNTCHDDCGKDFPDSSGNGRSNCESRCDELYSREMYRLDRDR